MSAETWNTIRAYNARRSVAGAATATVDAPTVARLPIIPTSQPQTIPGEEGATPNAEEKREREEPKPKADEKAPTVEKKPQAKDRPAATPKEKPKPKLWERLGRLPHAPKLPTPVDNVVSGIAAAPTPGGIGLLVVALVFFVFAIVPVGPNGETRLLLMWKALLGQVTLPDGAAPNVQTSDLQTLAYEAQTAVNVTEQVIGQDASAFASDAQASLNAAIDGASMALGW